MGFQQIQAPTLRELFVDQVIGMIFSGDWSSSTYLNNSLLVQSGTL